MNKTAKQSTAGEEFARYAAATRALLISVQARQNMLAALMHALLAAAGSNMADAERPAWIEGLRQIGGVFNLADDGADVSDWTPADYLAAAELARQSSAQLTAFVDSVAANLLRQPNAGRS